MITCNPVESEAWDALVTASPQGSIFSTAKWMNLFNVPYKLWGVYKGDELIGGWGGFEEPQPLTPFQSIIIKEPMGMNYTSIMSRHIEVAKCLMSVLPKQFYNSYAYTDIRPFKWVKNWQIDIKYSYLVDISDMAGAWHRMDKDARNTINTADAMIIHQPIEGFIPLYQQVFIRKNLPIPVSDKFLRNFATRMNPVIIGTDSTVAIAIRDNKRAYYILGASLGEGITPYVLWSLFVEMSARTKEIDLCGANDESIALYKRAMGGKLISYLGVKRDL